MISSPETKPVTDTACLNGLRTLFNICVVILHGFFFITLVLDHPSEAGNLLKGTFSSQALSWVLTLGQGSVDGFLLISGFLLKSSFSNSTPTLSTSLRYTVFRYLRLAPAYLTIAFILSLLEAPHCIRPTEALLVGIDDSKHLCIGVGWSTHVDFVSHIILLPLLAYPNILGMLLVFTPLLRAYTWIQRGRPSFPMPAVITDFVDSEQSLADVSNILGLQPGNFNLTDPELVRRRDMLDAFYPLYFGVQYRIAAVVVGVLVYSCMQKKNAVYRTVRKFPGMSVLFMTAVWVFVHVVERDLWVSSLAKAVTNCAGRILLAMATSVVIMLTCSIDDYPSEDVVSCTLRSVLSCKPVAFLQQFSYIVYLLHTITAPLLTLVPPKFNTDRLSAGWILVLAAKWYLCTMLVGLPVWGVEKLALRGRAWLRRKVPSTDDGPRSREKIA